MKRYGTRSLTERIKTRLEHEMDTRSVRLAAGLIRLTKGRIARLWRRQVLLLTTRGRKSGKERTVPLQFFPDGDDMIVVAANSGMPSPPGWYFNLTACPWARVEVGDRTLRVHAEGLSVEEAAAFWPAVLQIAPDYAKYPRRTTRRMRLIRLVPATGTEWVTRSRPGCRGMPAVNRQRSPRSVLASDRKSGHRVQRLLRALRIVVGADRCRVALVRPVGQGERDVGARDKCASGSDSPDARPPRPLGLGTRAGAYVVLPGLRAPR